MASPTSGASPAPPSRPPPARPASSCSLQCCGRRNSRPTTCARCASTAQRSSSRSSKNAPPGGVENQAIILEQRGTPVTTLLFSELGANTLGLAILVTIDLEKKDSGLIRRFAAATRAAYELAANEPDAAIDALVAVKPTLDRALSMAQLKAGMLLMQSPNGRGKPVGAMSEEDWTGTVALMKEFQGLETTLPPSAFWTNEYLPK